MCKRFTLIDTKIYFRLLNICPRVITEKLNINEKLKFEEKKAEQLPYRLSHFQSKTALTRLLFPPKT